MKIIGVGLNKTGTKTLRHCFLNWGFRHRSYDLNAFESFRSGNIEALLTEMESYDSFEDWPWPLMYREIDARFPEAKFILTIRKTPEHWYQSLCKMAVRMGPLNDFEKHIYGFSMPQGQRKHHIEYYRRFNEEVEFYFRDRPEKLLKICWEDGEDQSKRLAHFLGQPEIQSDPPKLNESLPVYAGDSLWRAHLSRIVFQTKWKIIQFCKRIKRGINRRIGR